MDCREGRDCSLCRLAKIAQKAPSSTQRAEARSPGRQSAGDAAENAVEEVDGLQDGAAAADFERFVDDDGEGRSLEADHLGDSHAKQVAVDSGHASHRGD